MAKPLMSIIMGLNVRHGERLPIIGPAIIVANHNSHLDTLGLMSLYPLSVLSKVHPVAAMDYFMINPVMKWLSLNLIGIIPIDRKARERGEDPFKQCYQALDEGRILIIYPEGTRGEPERLSTFKKGLSHLVERYPQVPVVPIFLHGFGKALPKGEVVLVPFFCDIFVGNPLFFDHNRDSFMQNLEQNFRELAANLHLPHWE